MEKKIEVIPASKKSGTVSVGIYCRVSSPSSAQLHSLAAQASYLTRLVSARRDWILADIYLDVESGASAVGRAEYNRMLEDAKRGHIKIVLVKSISRFGRDAETIISDTRKLSVAGAVVIFEEQGIDTRSAEAELYISLYAAVAQTENLNQSQNVKWGIRRKIENGTSAIFDRPCYGYSVDEHGDFTVIPEEATVVRRIYNEYLDGKSILKIKAALEKSNILSPSGKQTWSKRTIELMLKNKKYCGFSVAYKTYSEGEPKSKRKINKGEHAIVEIANHHEPIIPLELYEKVQQEIIARSNIEIGEDGTKKRKSTKYSAKKTQD